MAVSPARKPTKPTSKAKPARIVTANSAPTKRVIPPKYPDEVGTFEDLISDFRDVVAKVTDADRRYEIATTYGGTRYVVFRIKRFNKKIDTKKSYLSIAARKLRDKPSTVFVASRNLMFNVVITYNNIPRYIIEPRMAAARLLAAKLEIEDVDGLCAIVNGGSLIDLLELVPAEVEEERDAALKKLTRLRKRIDSQEQEMEQIEREKENMKRYQGVVLGDIGRVRDQLFEVSNIKISMDKRVHQLEDAMRAAAVPIPPHSK